MRTILRPFTLVLCVVALLAAPAWAVAVDPYLSDNTEAVVTLNVKQILNSPFVKKLGLEKAKAALKEETEIDQVLTDLGFDPFTDIDRIVTAGPGGDDSDKGLVIVHGRFDLNKFHAKGEAVAKDHGDVLKIHKVADGQGGQFKLYELSIPDQDVFFVALASKTTLVASPAKDYVIEACKVGAGQKKGNLKSKDLKELLANVDEKQSLWVAIIGNSLAKSPLAGTEQGKEALAKIQNVTGGVTLADDIKVEFQLLTKDTESAKGLAKTVDDGLMQAKGLVGLIAAGQKELAPHNDVLNKITTTTKDRSVLIKVEISTGEIKKDQ